MNVCLIPARGGSKRIPRKNIREFCGKPIIAWSIEAAKRAQCFRHIVVSTDDEEIADVSKYWGAEVPFMRPLELSDDFSGTTPVVADAIVKLQCLGIQPHAVCCLYATAPLVDPAMIRAGLDLLDNVRVDRFVFTATTYTSPIQRALRLCPNTGLARMYWPEHYVSRSQDLENAFHDAGQFYWARPDAWLQSSNPFQDSIPLLLPAWTVQDIDTEGDWRRAELMFNSLRNSQE